MEPICLHLIESNWYLSVQFELQTAFSQCVVLLQYFGIIFPFGFTFSTLTMPGHDHSLVPKLKSGDLGTHEAFFLWNCPIVDEGLSVRQHVTE